MLEGEIGKRKEKKLMLALYGIGTNFGEPNIELTYFLTEGVFDYFWGPNGRKQY